MSATKEDILEEATRICDKLGGCVSVEDVGLLPESSFAIMISVPRHLWGSEIEQKIVRALEEIRGVNKVLRAI